MRQRSVRSRAKNSRTIFAAAIFSAAVLLGGCAQTSPVASACPGLVSYDQKTRDKAAGEIDALPADSVLPGMMADYKVMRDQTRACIAAGHTSAKWPTVLFRR